MAKTPRKTTRKRKPATAKPAAPLAAMRREVNWLRNKLIAVDSAYTNHLLHMHREDYAPAARVLELEQRLAAIESAPVRMAEALERDRLTPPSDPLAGCVVVRDDSPLEQIVGFPAWRQGIDTVTRLAWSFVEPHPYDTTTHPAPCRETMTVEWPYCNWASWIRLFGDLHTRPLPGDASCLLGEDGVTYLAAISLPWQSTYMTGDHDGQGYDRFPDFTIPRSTTWWKPTWPQ